MRQPCHFHTRGDLLLVPDLKSVVTLLDGENKVVAKLGDGDDVSSFELRVTSTFRLEDEGWMLVHRHAEPIATSDPRGPLRSSSG